MQYDFSLQEAVDVMLHEDGWMQGNNFDKNTFLSYGRANNYFVLNNAGFRTDFMDDELCKKTIEVWNTIIDLFADTNLTNQKYWFIDYLCLNSVRDTGSYINRCSKRDYLKEYQRVRK